MRRGTGRRGAGWPVGSACAPSSMRTQTTSIGLATWALTTGTRLSLTDLKSALCTCRGRAAARNPNTSGMARAWRGFDWLRTGPNATTESPERSPAACAGELLYTLPTVHRLAAPRSSYTRRECLGEYLGKCLDGYGGAFFQQTSRSPRLCLRWVASAIPATDVLFPPRYSLSSSSAVPVASA